MSDETRDAYRLGQVERKTEENARRINALEKWQVLKDERDGKDAEQRAEDEHERDKKVNWVVGSLITFLVSVATALVTILISTGHL